MLYNQIQIISVHSYTLKQESMYKMLECVPLLQREGNLSAATGLVPRQPIPHTYMLVKRRGSSIYQQLVFKEEGTRMDRGVGVALKEWRSPCCPQAATTVCSSLSLNYDDDDDDDGEQIPEGKKEFEFLGGCLLFHRCSTVPSCFLSSWIAR